MDNLNLWLSELKSHVRKKSSLKRNNLFHYAKAPVLIVAGSCKKETGDDWDYFIKKLAGLLIEFPGWVISGGTAFGVCEAVGNFSGEGPSCHRSWKSVGYLPQSKASLKDPRYDYLVYTHGETFSNLEPLQYWTDLLLSGIKPQAIRLIRFKGGNISIFEQELAETLGASVITFAQ